MKYKVIVREILEREVEVDEKYVEDPYQAIDIIKEKYDDEKIVLDADDFGRTEFECGKIIVNR